MIRRGGVRHWVVLASMLIASGAHAAAGDLDCAFGSGGKTFTDFGGELEAVLNLGLQDDGKIVAAGSRLDESSSAFLVARYLPDGRLDPAFGDGGKLLNALEVPAFISAAARQADGKILAVGATSPAEAQTEDFFVARFGSDGSDDLAFGTDGARTLDFAGGADFAEALAVQEDGKIIVAGSAEIVSGDAVLPAFGLMRLNADGSPDSGFGIMGKVTTLVDPASSWDGGSIEAVAVQADGKIVAAGEVWKSDALESTGAFALARYLADGTLDDSFGVDGVVVTDLVNGSELATAVELLDDGRIAMVGSANQDASADSFGDEDWALMLYTAAGALDGTFGSAGVTVKDWGRNLDRPATIAVQTDGKYIVAGGSYAIDEQSLAVTGNGLIARFNSDGSLDTGFNTSSSGLLDAFYNTLLVLTDGAMIAAGSGIGSGGDPDLLLSRLSVEEGPVTSCAASGGGRRRGGGAMAWLSLIFLSLCGVYGVRRNLSSS